MNPLDPSEVTHHECSPPDLADDAAHFSARLRAIAANEHKAGGEIRLPDCDIQKLESEGHVQEKF